MTILGCEKTLFKKTLTHFFLLITVISCAVIVINILLAVFRTDATHIAFLVINIITDVALLWFIIWSVLAIIKPKKKLLAIYERGEKFGKQQTGIVKEVSDKSVCVQGFECRCVIIETGGVEYEIYVITNGIDLKTKTAYKLCTVENIVTSAEETK